MPSSQASFDDMENVPFWYGNTKRLQKMFEDALRFYPFENLSQLLFKGLYKTYKFVLDFQK